MNVRTVGDLRLGDGAGIGSTERSGSEGNLGELHCEKVGSFETKVGRLA